MSKGRNDALRLAFLRHENVHSADNWQSVLEPIISRYRSSDIPRFFRGNADFAYPEIYSLLESEDYFYAIRPKDNQILYNKIEHILTRPVGVQPRNRLLCIIVFGINQPVGIQLAEWLLRLNGLQENCFQKVVSGNP